MDQGIFADIPYTHFLEMQGGAFGPDFHFPYFYSLYPSAEREEYPNVGENLKSILALYEQFEPHIINTAPPNVLSPLLKAHLKSPASKIPTKLIHEDLFYYFLDVVKETDTSIVPTLATFSRVINSGILFIDPITKAIVLANVPINFDESTKLNLNIYTPYSAIPCKGPCYELTVNLFPPLSFGPYSGYKQAKFTSTTMLPDGMEYRPIKTEKTLILQNDGLWIDSSVL